MNNSSNKKNKTNKEEKGFGDLLKDAYSAFNKELVQTEIKDKEKKKEVLRAGIERVEKKAKKELKSSKMLLERLMEIRRKAEMAETIGTGGKIKVPIMFGKEEFNKKLERELLVIGTEELKEIGSAITISNLIRYFKETRPNWKIRTIDITQAIKRLEEAKIIPKRVDIGEDEVLIRFKPIELSNDINRILQLATGRMVLTVKEIAEQLDWPIERVQDTLSKLIELELAVLDEETGEYYFPGITKV